MVGAGVRLHLALDTMSPRANHMGLPRLGRAGFSAYGGVEVDPMHPEQAGGLMS